VWNALKEGSNGRIARPRHLMMWPAIGRNHERSVAIRRNQTQSDAIGRNQTQSVATHLQPRVLERREPRQPRVMNDLK